MFDLWSTSSPGQISFHRKTCEKIPIYKSFCSVLTLWPQAKVNKSDTIGKKSAKVKVIESDHKRVEDNGVYLRMAGMKKSSWKIRLYLSAPNFLLSKNYGRWPAQPVGPLARQTWLIMHIWQNHMLLTRIKNDISKFQCLHCWRVLHVLIKLFACCFCFMLRFDVCISEMW